MKNTPTERQTAEAADLAAEMWGALVRAAADRRNHQRVVALLWEATADLLGMCPDQPWCDASGIDLAALEAETEEC
jgi:hypothetical protein